MFLVKRSEGRMVLREVVSAGRRGVSLGSRLVLLTISVDTGKVTVFQDVIEGKRKKERKKGGNRGDEIDTFITGSRRIKVPHLKQPLDLWTFGPLE